MPFGLISELTVSAEMLPNVRSGKRKSVRVNNHWPIARSPSYDSLVDLSNGQGGTVAARQETRSRPRLRSSSR